MLNYGLYQPLKNEANTVTNTALTQCQHSPNTKQITIKNNKELIYAPLPEEYEIPNSLFDWAKKNDISEKALKIHVEMCLNKFQDGKTKRPGWERSIQNWARNDYGKINEKYKKRSTLEY